MSITERVIQEHIWKHRNKLYELFVEVDFPEIIIKDRPWELTPSEIIFNIVIEKYKNLWELVRNIHLFGCEVPLKKHNDSTIRADFLGVFEGENGLAIVELKKSSQTERQAFTELLGYGSHIRTLFAPMSKTDIAYILISPMQERIVRESVINHTIYEKSNTFAIIPQWTKDDISTLKLKPWIPSLIEIDNIINAVFSESNFELFKVTWDGMPGSWSPEKERDNPTSEMINRMNTVSSYAAQIMEERGIHGFCYASQAYSENRKYGHLINAINIVGLNPYKSTKNRFLLQECENVNLKDLTNISTESIDITDIIPELMNKFHDKYDTKDVFGGLSMSWNSEIIQIGFDVVNTLTMSISKDFVETSYGSFNWESFQLNFIEDVMVHNFDVRPTSLIRQLYWEYSKLDYGYIRESGCHEHPICYESDDIPPYLVDIMASHYFFRYFIRRLFSIEYED